ncbi:MAG: hypothetical protein V2J62_04160 [candidate division KSB1 bacterium]|jgi:hypothetical protein|nr:hypothetical protein [candidate division KSB1 bacterium]
MLRTRHGWIGRSENPNCHHTKYRVLPVCKIVFTAFVLHEADDAPLFLSEIRRIMKRDAKLVIIDFEKIEEEGGPPLEHRISRDDAIALLSANGFSIRSSQSLSKSHYQLVAAINDSYYPARDAE